MKKICTVLLLSLVLVAAIGQENPKGKWAIGGYAGPTYMFGSISGDFAVHGFDIGFVGQKALTHALSLRFDAGYAQYKDIENNFETGGRVKYTVANSMYGSSPWLLNFKTYTIYGDLLAQYNLPIHGLYGKEKTKFNIYIFGGVGLLFDQVTTNLWDKDASDDFKLKIADYRKTAEDPHTITRSEAKDIFDSHWNDKLATDPELAILDYKMNIELVGGLGMTYALNEKWEIFGEMRGATGFMDNNLDGVYRDAQGSQGAWDVMFSGRVGAKYRFHKNDKNAYDWFDNASATHYAKTQALEDKIDGIYSDADGDGVPDYLDKEPNTPAGASVDGSGRAMDADYDGIPDYQDDDLFTPKGSTVDTKGAGVDSDGDGVPDNVDLEPNTPAGSLVNFQGIAIAGAVAPVNNVPSIFFDYNSSSLSSDYVGSLASIIAQLNADSEAKVLIIGHTDYVGSEKYNYTLGMRRAEAVKDALVKAGVEEGRIMTDSKGKDEPLAGGKYKTSTMMNRRAEIKIVK